MVQDVVADAMTVEAVPAVDQDGHPIPGGQKRLMHTTMQTLGRVAIIGGSVLVAVLNLFMFEGVEAMSEAQKVAIYVRIYVLALVIPVVSVLGVILGGVLGRRELRRLLGRGFDRMTAEADPRPQRAHRAELVDPRRQPGVRRVHAQRSGSAGRSLQQEIIFVGSMVIIAFLMARLMRELDPEARRALVGTAIIIFVFRAIPLPGAGQTWWMIDELGFDQQFLSVLSLITSSLTLAGMFIFRRFMAERSIAYIVGVPDRGGHRAVAADHRHVLRAARVDRGRIPAGWSMRDSSPWSTPRSSRRSARSP